LFLRPACGKSLDDDWCPIAATFKNWRLAGPTGGGMLHTNVEMVSYGDGGLRLCYYAVEKFSDFTPGMFQNRTGAIYKIQARDRIWHLNTNEAAVQNYTPGPALVPQRLVRVRGHRRSR
jgi:hypothetical protein